MKVSYDSSIVSIQDIEAAVKKAGVTYTLEVKMTYQIHVQGIIWPDTRRLILLFPIFFG